MSKDKHLNGIHFLSNSISIGIYITFVGNAETLWSENSGDKRIAYRGKECYLNKRIYFIGEEDGNFIFYFVCVLVNTCMYYYCIVLWAIKMRFNQINVITAGENFLYDIIAFVFEMNIEC